MLKIRDLFFDNKKLIAALILFSLIQECAPLVIGLIQKRAFDALAKHHGSLFWLTILVFIGVVILINLSRQRYGMLDARLIPIKPLSINYLQNCLILGRSMPPTF